MSTETSRRDPNYVTTLMGVDMSTGLLPTKVFVDETTHRLLVSAVITGGSSSGTQYAEGTTTTPGTGTLAMGRYMATPPTLADGALSGLQLDTNGNLKVTGTFAVQATLAAETTKVIGVIRASDGAGNLLTSNSTTYTAKFGLDSNLLGTLGTAFTTAGKVDIKGADGDVFVRNATAANFLANVTLQTQTDTTMIGGVNVKELNGVAPLMGVGASGTGAQRMVLANDQGKTLVSTGGSASSSGNNTLVTAGTNKLKVFAFSLSTTSTTAVTCIFQSGASGTELWRVVLQASPNTSTGANLVVQPPASIFATGTATLLNLNLSGAQTVHWSVSYFDEA